MLSEVIFIVMRSAIMLIEIILIVIMLIVIMPNVLVPFLDLYKTYDQVLMSKNFLLHH